MVNKIKKNIDQELSKFIKFIDKKYKFSKISPPLYKSLTNFLSRDGKRIRPLLFVIAYKGFSNKLPRNLYLSALAIELLHCFLLIHDDILDNSDIRRGKPAMHILINNYINPNIKTESSGMALALVAGDIIYALAIEAFISMDEFPERKQKALSKFIESGFFTGCGEFMEIVNSKKPISEIRRSEIYRTYDFKTAYYTFTAPLVTGAILAGAKDAEIKNLLKFSKYCGQAFQIKDDITGIFADVKQTGKSNFTDLKEGKKTLLIWYAYKHAHPKDKLRLKTILSKGKICAKDIIDTRRILQETGSLNYCLNQVKNLINQSILALKTSRLKNIYKQELINYCQQILSL
ncbi:MAG: polyprenyl synthetase family protein [Candidatus Omnitrophota bacterium]